MKASSVESSQQKYPQAMAEWLISPREPILSLLQLKRLGEHKYSCQSSSVLEPFMQPWWNWLVQQVPMWLAPNLITILGLMVNIVTSLILVYYSPNGKEEVPRWACLLCALGLFVYQSLDAIDGKQARRTGSSSPLGELFDHGCDSISTVFVSLAACTAVGLGTHPWWMFFQCFSSLILFYCAHWQTYVSGTMRFGKFDVTEAQFGVISLHMGTVLFGMDGWNVQIPGLEVELKLVVEVVIFAITINAFVGEYLLVILRGGSGKNGSTIAVPGLNCRAVVAAGAGTLLVYITMALSHLGLILRGGAGKNGSTVAGTSVISPAIPLAMVAFPAYIIACKSEERIYEEHPALYIIAFGLVAAKVTNRLVVAHMTRSEMDYLDSILWGPALLFLNQYFNNFFREYYVLWLCLILSLWDLLRYCRTVCLEICQALHIELFRIKPVADPARSTNGSGKQK